MADIQEETTGKMIALSTQCLKFGKDELSAMLKWILENNRPSVNVERGGREADGHSGKAAKVSVKELSEENPNGKLSSLTLDPKDKKAFDDVMREYGVKYAIKEHPVKDDDGKQVYDYSKCKFEMEEDGKTPKLDYSKCKVEKDSAGKDIIGNDGKPSLAPDSPKPQPKLAPHSPKPQPLKQVTVFFQAKNDEVMQDAWKAFVEGQELKQEKKEQKEARKEERQENRKLKRAEKQETEKPKVNIKKMIKKNTERANDANKDNPEKHHNRGEQSL